MNIWACFKHGSNMEVWGEGWCVVRDGGEGKGGDGGGSIVNWNLEF